jgi:hypothetical protein
MAGDEMPTVERQDTPTGVSRPFQPAPSGSTRELLARLEQAIAYAREVVYMSEDELADLLDLSKPA